MTGPDTGRRPPRAGRDRTGIAAIAVTLLAIVCCAGGPAILAVFGSVALGAVVGWAAGGAALVVVVVGLVLAARRRHASSLSSASSQAKR